MYVFTNPFARAGCDTRSNFKRSLTGLSLVFSFSKTGCLTKNNETKSVLLFTHNWMGNNWIHTSPKGICAMWNAISLVQNLNFCRPVHFFMKISITPWALIHACVCLFGLVLWHINHCRLFIAKCFLYSYIEYIWFGWVWSGFMAYQPL